MKKTNPIVKTLFRKTCAVIGAAALISGIHNSANATQTVRELWDGSSGNHPINGVTGNDVSSLGFDATTNWTTSPAGNTSIRFDNWNLDWMIGNGDVLLPPTANGNSGLMAFYGSDGNMTSSLTNPATGLPYGNYASQCYATRVMTTNAYINFNANGTYYFSVRFVAGGGWNWWSGDMAGGVGFASSGATNAHFAGAGWTRTSYLAEDGVTAIGNSAYISAGTLDQAGIASHPDDSGSVYYARTNGPVGALASGGGYLLVGQLITTVGGASTINVKIYPGYNAPATDPGSITWDATYNFTETNVMKNFLLWEYGTGPAVMDAVRVGTSYGDAIGLEIVGAPNATPGSTVYAGTAVTLSTTFAGLNTTPFPISYQWLSNSVPLDPTATNATYALTGTTTNFTADYSLAVANSYGMITSAVTHLTVLPATPVYITSQPVSITRYLNSPKATFTVGVNGTPPYAFQWKHAGTNIQSSVTTSALGNTLMLPPISLADAGNYSCTITNQFGTTNSSVVTLTEIMPAAGSYAAAVTALSPYGYWRMDDNGNADPTVYDYFGWNNGAALDTNNMTFGSVGSPYVGWAAPHNATFIGNQSWNTYRLNLPALPVYTNTMTFTMWVNGGCELMTRNGYGNAYGLENNSGNLQFDWGGVTSWNSGLSVPANTWTFVALVVEPTQATIYIGTNVVSNLVSAQQTGLTISDSTTLGDTSGLTPLAVARNPWPWAEGGNGAPWASMTGTWSDVAIYYQSLTPTQIQNLYLAGVGYQLQGASDGAGNLVLNWIGGVGSVLQQANTVDGPYTDIGAATPPYSVPLTGTGNKFYRVKH